MAFAKFHPFVCQRAVILQGEIIQGKLKICVGYFSMRNPYMKFLEPQYIRTHTETHTRAAPVAEWVMSLNFSALNHSIISLLCLPHWPHVRQVKFCLRVCQLVFLGTPVLPNLPNGSSRYE